MINPAPISLQLSLNAGGGGGGGIMKNLRPSSKFA